MRFKALVVKRDGSKHVFQYDHFRTTPASSLTSFDEVCFFNEKDDAIRSFYSGEVNGFATKTKDDGSWNWHLSTKK